MSQQSANKSSKHAPQTFQEPTKTISEKSTSQTNVVELQKLSKAQTIPCVNL